MTPPAEIPVDNEAVLVLLIDLFVFSSCEFIEKGYCSARYRLNS